MTHFSVIVCLDDKDGLLARAAVAEKDFPGAIRSAVESQLEAVLAPWDENSEAVPYRDYEDGGPEDHWVYQTLKEAGENERNGTGILPYEPDALGWSSNSSKSTPDEQRVEIARKAALFQSLPEPVTWEAVIDMSKILYPDDDAGLLIDEEDDSRAYRMSTYNPESKWDYWRIGGRWGGYFTRKADSDGASFLLPEKGWDSPDKFGFSSADAAPKGLLDLAAQRQQAADAAVKAYQGYHALVDHLPEALPWRVFADNISEGNGYTIGQARQEYQAQPRVRAVQGTDWAWSADAVEQFGVSLNAYAEKARAGAVPGFALVTTRGQWMAPGQMGWFGATDASDDSRAGYWEGANAYIEALPDDTWLVAVDCHI